MSTLDTVMSARVSRRTLLKGVGAAGVGLALAQAGMLGSVAAASETVTDIINIAATAEALAVTLLGGALDSAAKGGYNKAIPDPVVAILKAARAEEQYHLDYLQGAGAKPLTTTFNVPDPKLLSDYNTLFTTLVTAEGLFIAAYASAAREFAEMNHPELVKVAFQIGTVEAEHRVLANYALGTRPANNVAFEKMVVTTVGDAAATLKQLGFIGGSGTAVTYPGSAVDKSNVTETTPGGPAVSCTVAAPAAPTPTPAMPGLPNTGGGYGSTNGNGGLQEMLGFLGLFGAGAAALGVLSRRLNAHAEERAAKDAEQE
ncbi:MAG TPA: ferritin-like domain-containing protein [Thermomicrobiales bacterium]|nr:ferritin-like domain-containing protein [Thermomicrobiales bacterium]